MSQKDPSKRPKQTPWRAVASLNIFWEISGFFCLFRPQKRVLWREFYWFRLGGYLQRKNLTDTFLGRAPKKPPLMLFKKLSLRENLWRSSTAPALQPHSFWFPTNGMRCTKFWQVENEVLHAKYLAYFSPWWWGEYYIWKTLSIICQHAFVASIWLVQFPSH